MRLCSLAFLVIVLSVGTVVAQSSSQSPTPTATPTLSLSLTTASVTTTTTSRIDNNHSTQIVTVVPTTFNVTFTITPTSSSPTSTLSATPSATPIVLSTKLDPAFGVLGGILIVTGLPSTFWGHKNRWTSFFLIGFYTLALVCMVLILKFGVLDAVNPPSKTLRGMFVLACSVAGIAGGATAIFFWKAARYCIGGWGGLAFGFWIQCFHNGGVIHTIGFRWIMFIAFAVVGFVLCTIPKIHYHILLLSTSFVGSSAIMLGVDCFTTAGLKEFYVWNLGFESLFPKFKNNGIHFPVSQTMQIELGLIGAIALMGASVQLRILTVLQRKLREIQEEQKRRDEEAETEAADRFNVISREREQWEKEHGKQHMRMESNYSSVPLLRDQDAPKSPGTPHSDVTLTGTRSRHQSGISEFMAAAAPEDDLKKAVSRYLQTPGSLPALDLGLGIQDEVPQTYISKDEPASSTSRTSSYGLDSKDLKLKEDLQAEIATIRRSIDALRAETPPLTGDGRRPSVTSRRTLSIDAANALLAPPDHLRPPRERDPRARTQSMELSTFTNSQYGEGISRPTSVPLRDEDWDTYVQERKLLQPPSGVTPPIATSLMATTPSGNPRIHMPAAVTEAIDQRKRRESALVRDASDSSEEIPLVKLDRHKRSNSAGGNIPVTILPPKKNPAPIIAPQPQRPITKTFEELNERHREKMRDLQGPVTQAQKEHAELEAAKQRWERSIALEREAVAKRQAEKAAQLEKRKKSGEEERPARKSLAGEGDSKRRHSRSLSADKLNALGGPSSRRLSTMRVEDWQKYQQETAANTGHGPEARGSRGGRSLRGPIPFPGDLNDQRHKSRQS